MGDLLAAINAVRAQARSCGSTAMPAASALSWNSALASAAAGHSADMAANNFFDHVGTGGSTLTSRVNAAGYAWSALAENIAAGNSTAAATVSQWVASPSHCQAMMSATYVHVGGSCMYNASATYRYYWTIDLGRP
ncbi:CAP domain-containing protein [Ottowia sp.]|uniref:CAP domain-containing protein n=1 Tax=Ottowia sp. TaxID=1898956 RepID=UPI0039E5A4F6